MSLTIDDAAAHVDPDRAQESSPWGAHLAHLQLGPWQEQRGTSVPLPAQGNALVFFLTNKPQASPPTLTPGYLFPISLTFRNSLWRGIYILEESDVWDSGLGLNLSVWG